MINNFSPNLIRYNLLIIRIILQFYCVITIYCVNIIMSLYYIYRYIALFGIFATINFIIQSVNRSLNALLNALNRLLNALLVILFDKKARNIDLLIIINNKTFFYNKLISIETCYHC